MKGMKTLSYLSQDVIKRKYLSNIYLNEREIKEKKLILSSRPRRLFVMPTKRCNLDCIMCARANVSVSGDRADLSSKVMDEIVGLFPYLDFIEWQGGEVFLYKNFYDILQRSSDYPQLKQVITTNGLLIDKDWADLIVKNDIKLNISIDSATAKTYEYIRKGGKFARLIENLEIINKKMQRYNKKDIIVNMLVVVMKSNYKETNSLIDFAKKYNFKKIIFNYMNPETTLASKESIFFPLDREAVGHLHNTFAKYIDDDFVFVLPHLKRRVETGIRDGYENVSMKTIELRKKNLFCFFPWVQLAIEPDVNFSPHCFCLKKEYSSNMDISLKEMWNSEIMRAYRDKMARADYRWCREDCLARDSEDDFFKAESGYKI